MLIGYNNDVEHRGKTFHIQTEDRGANDDKIETQLFHGGAILDTKITAYSEHIEGLEGKARDKKIKSIMKASHRSLFKNLLAGEYDEMVGLEPVKKPEEAVEENIDDFEPGRDGVPSAAVKIEEEGIEALEEEAAAEGFEDPAGEDHVDISQLKDKLAGLKKAPAEDDAEADEAVAADTQVMDPLPVEDDPFDDVQLGETGKMQAVSAEPKAPSVEVAKTGVAAWTGCAEPDEDLSLTELIEESLAS